MSDNDSVEIFTDGACRGNPGPGGWGVLLRYNKIEKRLYGGCSDKTTSNRMDIMAAIKGLAALKRPSKVIVTTNNSYVIQGITEQITKWKKYDWNGISNKDLWEQLESEVSKHQVKWCLVKTKKQPVHRESEIADQLANQGIDELRRNKERANQ